MNELETIKAPIKEDLTYFETEFKQALNSDVKLINSISGFLIKNRGKRIEPILTLCSVQGYVITLQIFLQSSCHDGTFTCCNLDS